MTAAVARDGALARPGTAGAPRGAQPGRPRSRTRPPSGLLALSILVAAVLLVPLVFLLIEAAGAGVGAVASPDRPASSPRSCCGTPSGSASWSPRCARSSGPAPRGWSSAPTCPAAGVGGASRRAAGDPRLRGQLRVGVAQHRCDGLPRRRSGDDAVGLPAGLPAGRRQLPQRRPDPGGGGARPRRRAGSDLLPHHARPGEGRHPRRLPARGHGHAGRVRRVRDPRLPDLHDRDLHRVLGVVRRRRRLRALARAGRAGPARRSRPRRSAARRRPGQPARPDGAAGQPPPPAGSVDRARAARCWLPPGGLALGVPVGSAVYWWAAGHEPAFAGRRRC